MNSLLTKIGQTNPAAIPLLILRIAFVIVMFPHGAQLLVGWFGGYGYAASMGYFSSIGIPSVISFLIIFLEFFGSIFILLGLFTRLFALALTGLVTGMILMVHIHAGFFMNWFGNLKGEGFEYHILMLSMLLSLLIAGGGKASLDALLFNKKV
ncbi:putative oxidoreductase [Chitinophaga rupis]|uniref:Putative oxidoreductase n=1 Tax=Chitinophaga rupis TaxID=573321 RepID=A0A1H8IRR2_9BACT|nr:DoxX family protein [Chitinophaga rupis]SEN71343.1 putative oxidoreductase [Chitinophaga rupis]